MPLNCNVSLTKGGLWRIRSTDLKMKREQIFSRDLRSTSALAFLGSKLHFCALDKGTNYVNHGLRTSSFERSLGLDVSERQQFNTSFKAPFTLQLLHICWGLVRFCADQPEISQTLSPCSSLKGAQATGWAFWRVLRLPGMAKPVSVNQPEECKILFSLFHKANWWH